MAWVQLKHPAVDWLGATGTIHGGVPSCWDCCKVSVASTSGAGTARLRRGMHAAACAAAAAELGRLGHTQRAVLRDVGLLNGRASFGCFNASAFQH
jgi:hypothetical protein